MKFIVDIGDNMNEQEMIDLLVEVLRREDEGYYISRVKSIRDFSELLILNKGLSKGIVVKTEDDSEFQITVVKSR